jgi:uncharacterized membrane protein
MNLSKQKLIEYFIKYKSILISSILLIIVGTLSIFTFWDISQKYDGPLISTRINRLGELRNIGGFYYQNVEVNVDGSNVLLDIQLKSIELETIKEGKNIYVKQVSPNLNVYTFAGFQRTSEILWLLIIFVGLLLIILGTEGMKYILPTVITLILITNQSIQNILINNIYLGSIFLLGIVGFASIYLWTKNIKVTSTITISQILTLVLILLFNTIIFKNLILTDMYYDNINLLNTELKLSDFWALLNAGVIFMSFGASLNTAFDVASSIFDQKKRSPNSTTKTLLKEGYNHNRLAIARIINMLFFIFIGISLMYILWPNADKYIYFWDEANVAYALVLFVNSAIAAMLIGPITAIVSAIIINSKKDDQTQLQLTQI